MIDWTRLTPAVERAAGIAIASFPAHHDVSDVKQEIWVWIMENKKTVTRILTEENGLNTLTSYLVKAGQTHLKEEDAAVYGYSAEDQYFYSLELIKSVLEVIFKHEDWQSFAQNFDAMPKAKTNPAHTGNNLASYADVSSAVDQLPQEQYNIMVWRYKYTYTFENLGSELGISRQAAEKRHDTALKAIQALLGRKTLAEVRTPPETSSRPSTMAQARAVTDRSYDG